MRCVHESKMGSAFILNHIREAGSPRRIALKAAVPPSIDLKLSGRKSVSEGILALSLLFA